MALESINPMEYIKPHDPIPEAVRDVSRWFKTETVELTFGREIGRPSELITADREMLAWYFSQGWYIDAVLGSGGDGTWKSVATANAQQMANAMSASQSSNSSRAQSKGIGKTKASDVWEHSWAGPDGTGSEITVLGTETNSSSEGSNDGHATSTGNSSNSGSSQSTTEQDGGPYWFAFQRLRLKRRKMQSETVLQDMIESFTKAYNEGRTVNDERYDELVALYSIMLRRTEDEANALPLSVDDFKPLADMVTNAVKKALENYAASVSDLPDDWMRSRIEEINRKFDALLGEAKSKMVSAGTYNSTVWPTTASGIERDRQIALNELKDAMVTLRVDVMGKIAGITADIGGKLLDCETRIIEAQHKLLLGPTELRNTVFKWMLDFMERRDDDYPGLDQLVTVADRLGYGDGAAAGPEA